MNQTVQTIEQNKPKGEYGDYKTLGRMLGCAPETARMRVNRNNPEAIAKLKLIIEQRENLVKSQSGAESSQN